MIDRRQFMVTAGAAGAALGLPAMGRAQTAAPRPRDARSIYVDGQGGPNGWDEKDGKMVPQQRLIDAVRERRIDIMSATVAEVGNGPDRFQQGMEAIAGFDQLIAEQPGLLMKVESAADIDRAVATNRCGIIYNFQDTTALETDSSRVNTFKTLGVRVMQLTYNKRNLAGDGCLERSNAGLSDFGREVIAKINEADMLLDLSHAGQRTIAEGLSASKAPPAITHSGCRALADLPRNTPDAEMRALAQKGGVFGLYLMPFLRTKGQPQREDLIRHIEHALKICGEDHIGIGTDNPLMGYTIDDKTREQQRKFFEDRKKRGVAAPGEAADVLNLVEGYNDATRYDRLASDLKARGWSSARVEKLLGGNFVRLFREVWKA